MPQDLREAGKWLRKAAEQGHADSQYILGLMYALGKGMPDDYVEAYVWWNLAAAQGHERAVKSKDMLRPKMTLDQVAEAQKLSAELHKRIEASVSE